MAHVAPIEDTSAPPAADAEAAPGARSLVIPAEFVPERAGTVAFLSSQGRRGDWMLPRLFRVVSVFGNVEIDLTRARVGPGTSRIEVRAIMGNVEIIVPPDLRVECDGSGVLANFEVDTKAQTMIPWDAPLISIGGTAFMANVRTSECHPATNGRKRHSLNSPRLLQPAEKVLQRHAVQPDVMGADPEIDDATVGRSTRDA